MQARIRFLALPLYVRWPLADIQNRLALAYAKLGHRNDLQRLFSAVEEKEDPIDDTVWAIAYLTLGNMRKRSSDLKPPLIVLLQMAVSHFNY